MKIRIYSLLFIMAFFAANVFAQEWTVYEASVLPGDADPAWSESNTGGNYSWKIVDDPDMPGNEVLELLSLDTTGSAMYKTAEFSPVPTMHTAAFRVKLTGEGDRVNELDLHINGLRDQLIIKGDNSVSLQRSGGSAAPEGLDVTQWNIFRVTLDASSGTEGAVKVYLNEDDTPIIEATTTTATDDSYIRIGDGQSGSTYSSLTDWIIYDNTGAYSPSESPLPPMNQKKIVFVGDEVIDTATTKFTDQPFLDKLEAEGYEVQYLRTPANLSTADDGVKQTLNSADLVIIGRSANSGQFQAADDKNAWNRVEAPVMSLSAYIVRNTRMNWFNSSSASHFNIAADSITTAEILTTGDAVFTGLDVSGGDLDWFVGKHSSLLLPVEEQANIEGELLARASDTIILMARFTEGVEFYTGSLDKPIAPRTYFGLGNDNDDGGAVNGSIYNYYQFTPESEQVWLAEVERMVNLEYTLADLPSADATLADLQVNGTTVAGFSPATVTYTVEVEAGATAEITATATDANATVEVPTEVTINGANVITVTAEDGYTTKEYTLTINEAGAVTGIRVMVVADTPPESDAAVQAIMEAVNEIEADEEVNAVYVPLSTYQTLDAAGFEQYDAAVLTESGSSSNYTNLGEQGFPIPAVILKAYVLGKTGFDLLDGEDPIQWFPSDEASTNEESRVMTIKNPNHPIFNNLYSQDQEVTWSTAAGTGAHVQGMDLSKSPNPDVATSATLLAVNNQLAADSKPGFMWAVEENATTKRMVTWGVHHFFLTGDDRSAFTGTEDFLAITKNSVLWVMDLLSGGGNPNEVPGKPDVVSVYPNPATATANVSFTLEQPSAVSLKVIDLAGKTLVNVLDNEQISTRGTLTYPVNVSGLEAGMYVYKLSINGEIRSGKILVR